MTEPLRFSSVPVAPVAFQSELDQIFRKLLQHDEAIQRLESYPKSPVIQPAASPVEMLTVTSGLADLRVQMENLKRFVKAECSVSAASRCRTPSPLHTTNGMRTPPRQCSPVCVAQTTATHLSRRHTSPHCSPLHGQGTWGSRSPPRSPTRQTTFTPTKCTLFDDSTFQRRLTALEQEISGVKGKLEGCESTTRHRLDEYSKTTGLAQQQHRGIVEDMEHVKVRLLSVDALAAQQQEEHRRVIEEIEQIKARVHNADCLTRHKIETVATASLVGNTEVDTRFSKLEAETNKLFSDLEWMKTRMQQSETATQVELARVSEGALLSDKTVIEEASRGREFQFTQIARLEEEIDGLKGRLNATEKDIIGRLSDGCSPALTACQSITRVHDELAAYAVAQQGLESRITDRVDRLEGVSVSIEQAVRTEIERLDEHMRMLSGQRGMQEAATVLRDEAVIRDLRRDTVRLQDVMTQMDAQWRAKLDHYTEQSALHTVISQLTDKFDCGLQQVENQLLKEVNRLDSLLNTTTHQTQLLSTPPRPIPPAAAVTGVESPWKTDISIVESNIQHEVRDIKDNIKHLKEECIKLHASLRNKDDAHNERVHEIKSLMESNQAQHTKHFNQRLEGLGNNVENNLFSKLTDIQKEWDSRLKTGLENKVTKLSLDDAVARMHEEEDTTKRHIQDILRRIEQCSVDAADSLKLARHCSASNDQALKSLEHSQNRALTEKINDIMASFKNEYKDVILKMDLLKQECNTSIGKAGSHIRELTEGVDELKRRLDFEKGDANSKTSLNTSLIKELKIKMEALDTQMVDRDKTTTSALQNIRSEISSRQEETSKRVNQRIEDSAAELKNTITQVQQLEKQYREETRSYPRMVQEMNEKVVKQIAELESKDHTKDVTLNDLKCRNENLTQRIEESRHEVADLNNHHQALKAKTDKISEDMATMIGTNNTHSRDVKGRVETLEGNTHEIRTTLKDVHRELRNLQEEARTKGIDMQGQQSKLEGFAVDLKGIRNMATRTEQELSDARKGHGSFKQFSEQVSTQIKELQSSHNILNGDVAGLTQRTCGMEGRIQEMNERYNQPLAETKAMTSTLHNQLQSVTDQIDRLSNKINRDSDMTLQTVSRKSDELAQEVEKKIQGLTNTMREYRTKIEITESQMKDSIGSITNSLQLGHKENTAKIDDLSTKIELFQKNVQDIRSQINRQENGYGDLRQQLRLVQEKEDTFNSEQCDMRNKQTIATQDINHLKTKLETLSSHKTVDEDRVVELEQKLNDMRGGPHGVAALGTDLTKLQDSLLNCTRKDELSKVVDSLEQKINYVNTTLEQQLGTITHTANTMRAKAEALEQAVRDSRNSIQSSFDDFKSEMTSIHHTDVQDLNNKVEGLCGELRGNKTSQQKQENSVGELRQQLLGASAATERLEDQINQEQERLNKLWNELAQVKTRNDTTVNKVASLESKTTDLQDKSNQLFSEMRTHNVTSNNVANDVQAALENQIRQLGQQVEALDGTLDRKCGSIGNDLERKFGTLQSRVTDNQNGIGALDSAMADSRAALQNNIDDVRRAIDDRTDGLQRRCEATANECKMFRAVVQKMEASNAELFDNSTSQKDQNHKLLDNLADLKAKIMQDEADISKLRARMDNVCNKTADVETHLIELHDSFTMTATQSQMNQAETHAILNDLKNNKYVVDQELAKWEVKINEHQKFTNRQVEDVFNEVRERLDKMHQGSPQFLIESRADDVRRDLKSYFDLSLTDIKNRVDTILQRYNSSEAKVAETALVARQACEDAAQALTQGITFRQMEDMKANFNVTTTALIDDLRTQYTKKFDRFTDAQQILGVAHDELKLVVQQKCAQLELVISETVDANQRIHADLFGKVTEAQKLNKLVSDNLSGHHIQVTKIEEIMRSDILPKLGQFQAQLDETRSYAVNKRDLVQHLDGISQKVSINSDRVSSLGVVLQQNNDEQHNNMQKLLGSMENSLTERLLSCHSSIAKHDAAIAALHDKTGKIDELARHAMEESRVFLNLVELQSNDAHGAIRHGDSQARQRLLYRAPALRAIVDDLQSLSNYIRAQEAIFSKQGHSPSPLNSAPQTTTQHPSPPPLSSHTPNTPTTLNNNPPRALNPPAAPPSRGVPPAPNGNMQAITAPPTTSITPMMGGQQRGASSGDVIGTTQHYDSSRLPTTKDMMLMATTTNNNGLTPQPLLANMHQRQSTTYEEHAVGGSPSIGIDISDFQGNSDTKGVPVSNVKEHGAGGRAGMKVGDIIFAVNGAPVTSREAFKQVVYKHKPGNTLNISVVRQGACIEIPVVLGVHKGGSAMYSSTTSSPPDNHMVTSLPTSTKSADMPFGGMSESWG